MNAKNLKLIYSTAKVRLGFLIAACAPAGIAVSPAATLSAWQVLVLSLLLTGAILDNLLLG